MRGAPIPAAMAAARGSPLSARRNSASAWCSSIARPPLRCADDRRGQDRRLCWHRAPQLAKGTRIYDATALAMRVLRDAGASAGSVVLLSDGADVGSHLKPGAAVDAARHAKTQIFSVGLRSRSYDGLTLRGLASCDRWPLRRGRRGSARADVRRARAELRSRVSHQLSLAGTARRRTSTSGCSVAGVAGTASAGYMSPALRGAGPANSAARSTFLGSDASLGLAVGLAALLFGLAARSWSCVQAAAPRKRG